MIKNSKTVKTSDLAAGVGTALATPSSANLAAAITDETGTGALVFATNPAVGLANATGRASSAQTADQFKTTGTAVSLSSTPPVIGQVIKALTATTSAWTTIPSGDVTTTGAVIADHLVSYDDTTGDVIEDAGFAKSDVQRISTMGSGVNTFLTTATSAALAAAVSDETGSGALVFGTSPTLTTPTFVNASGTLTSCTDLPISTGVSGLAAGVAAALASPSSAAIKAMCTDETGSGSLVFGTAPTITAADLGTPTTLVLTNATGRATSSQTADKLATSGTPIDLGLTPPVAGYTLVATSASTATWQAPAVNYGSVTGLTVGGASADGVATSLARADHVHALPVFGIGSGQFAEGNDTRLSNDRTASGIRTATTVVSASAAAAPTTGQVLTATSGSACTWQTLTGTGDVVGPATATDNLVATHSGTTGKLLKSTTTPFIGTPTGVLSSCTGRVNANQTADRIATAGSPVVVSGTAPTVGQTLVASSATAASWVTPATTAGTAILLASDFALTTSTVNVTGMSWSLGIGTYEFSFDAIVSVTAGTPLPTLGGAYTGSTTEFSARLFRNGSAAGSVQEYKHTLGAGASMPFSIAWGSSIPTGSTTLARLYGVITTSSSGTFTIQAKTTAGSTVGLLARSIGKVYLV